MRNNRFIHLIEWTQRVDQFEQRLKGNADLRWGGHDGGQHLRQALGSYKLACFAERLRGETPSTWDQPRNEDTLRLFLINKHHWTLEQARQVVGEEDFLYLLRDEVMSMKLTEKEAGPVKDSVFFRDGFQDFAQHYAEPEK